MLTSIVFLMALSASPVQTADPSGRHATAPVTHAKQKAKRVRAPKPPTTTATGTTTPQPSEPAGTVPPGAPGTKDPTMPGSPPH